MTTIDHDEKQSPPPTWTPTPQLRWRIISEETWRNYLEAAKLGMPVFMSETGHLEQLCMNQYGERDWFPIPVVYAPIIKK